jgi:hypothetical protein
MTVKFDNAIEASIFSILKNVTDELNDITDPVDLERYWYYDSEKLKHLTEEARMYEFMQHIDMYRRQCRRWEEIHNGSSSVVERVRDKYLMPKIKEFIEMSNKKTDV